MGTITCYIPDALFESIKNEVKERQTKNEIIGGKVVGVSHIIQEAIAARYKKKRK